MLGNHSYSLSGEKGFKAGNFTSIAGGCSFHSIDNHAWIGNRKCISTFPFKERWEMQSYPPSSGNGEVEIGNDVWIGEGVHMAGGIKIGDGAIIGFGSIVLKDVPPFAIVVGNPARVIKYRFPKKTRETLLRIQWWNWDEGRIKDNANYLTDIDKFIEICESL
jgi:virginiamycin A acetyltransferase